MTNHRKSTFVMVHFLPRDRAAIARAAFERDRGIAEFIEQVVIAWLDTEKLRTVHIPEITVEDYKSPRSKRSAPIVEGQQKFDVT